MFQIFLCPAHTATPRTRGPYVMGGKAAPLPQLRRYLLKVIRIPFLVGVAEHKVERTVQLLYQFVGIGKPDVLLYGSHHLAGALNERPLVALRSDLAELGLTRDAAIGETEDHLSFLFEVMRYMIAGDDVAVCNLERQRLFFRVHLQPWVADALCDAVTQHPRARLYAALAAFTRAFVQVETQAFDMIE